MAGDGTIEINRTLETLSHPRTLETLRDAPLTMGHPPKGVTADNFQKLIVGYVSNEQRVGTYTVRLGRKSQYTAIQVFTLEGSRGQVCDEREGLDVDGKIMRIDGSRQHEN